MESFSIFILFLSSIFPLIPPCSTHHPIISLCNNISQSDPSIEYAFCTTSLQVVPASANATLHALGAFSFHLVLYNITDTRFHIKHLLKSPKVTDPYVRRCLDDCLELYTDAIPDVKQAMGYYEARRYGDANVKITAVMDASTTCEDGFKERRGVTSPLSKRNHDVFELSAIALSIMKLI